MPRTKIEMKLGMGHYGHKSVLDAKFEAGSTSSFGDTTSQNFPRKKEMSHQIWLFTPGKRVLFLKNEFSVQNRSSRPNIEPPCQFHQFSSREKIFIFKIFGTSRREKSSSNPLIDQFC